MQKQKNLRFGARAHAETTSRYPKTRQRLKHYLGKYVLSHLRLLQVPRILTVSTCCNGRCNAASLERKVPESVFIWSCTLMRKRGPVQTWSNMSLPDCREQPLKGWSGKHVGETATSCHSPCVMLVKALRAPGQSFESLPNRDVSDRSAPKEARGRTSSTWRCQRETMPEKT